MPTAIYFGKRPVFLTACFLLFLCCIWAAVAKSFEGLLAATVVGAFAGGATEALGAAIVNVCMILFPLAQKRALRKIQTCDEELIRLKDLFFLHERGSKMGYYIVAISWGSNIGPLCGGFIIGSRLLRLHCLYLLLILQRCRMEMAEMGQRHLSGHQLHPGVHLRSGNTFPPRFGSFNCPGGGSGAEK